MPIKEQEIMLKKAIAAIVIISLSTTSHGNFNIHQTDSFVESEINCLGEAIYREARGESITGMSSVGLVVMNRVKSGKFPKTVCGVTHQRTRGMCQFSYVCNKSLPPIRESEKFKSFYLAKMIYRHQIKDITHGSTFFDMGKMSTNKKMHIAKSIKIGLHQFYKDKS